MVMAIGIIAVGCCCYWLGVRKGKRLAWNDFALNYIVIHKSTIINNKKRRNTK